MADLERPGDQAERLSAPTGPRVAQTSGATGYSPDCGTFGPPRRRVAAPPRYAAAGSAASRRTPAVGVGASHAA